MKPSRLGYIRPSAPLPYTQYTEPAAGWRRGSEPAHFSIQITSCVNLSGEGLLEAVKPFKRNPQDDRD